MANPFQQKSRQRKVVYLGLIVALLTGSILHREYVVKKQARDLQLMESEKGEVELTSAFVRLSLIGSRGLATTFLWSQALDRQEKHEWNELELLVGSISKLQPYFVTPWLFQSWNLAFNVAVECDRPRDKYYYVSRGLEFLAEGERRNQGTDPEVVRGTGRPQFPGNPEMRFYMGFYYQLKIGNSDEKNAMRCLLDLSCIDPLQRNPSNFWTLNERGQQVVKLDELARLCQDHPRLVRRLREQLGYDTPNQIVKFLDANKDVPTRYKKTLSSNQKDSELEEPRKQFPVLPPVKPRERGSEGPAWPDPKESQLSREAVDVFLISRTWYQYAQEPLPPPIKDPGVTVEEDKAQEELERRRTEENINYRAPKAMAIEIFRGYPGRAQVYIAENLQSEGWFDDDGWAIKGWFDRADDEQELRVGIEPKYFSGPAWDQAYTMFNDFGVRNGLYISPAETAELERKAMAVRALTKKTSNPDPEMRAKFQDSFDAMQKLTTNAILRSMTNFDAALFQAEGERHAQTVQLRKLLHQAGRYEPKGQYEALPLYEKAWPLWVDISLRHPIFAQVINVQEEVYEAMLKYMRMSQNQNRELFKAANLGLAQMAIAPHPSWPQPCNWNWGGWPYWDSPKAADRPWLIDPALKSKQLSVRNALGPLELIAYYDGPKAAAVRQFCTGMTVAAGQLGQPGCAPPVLLPEYTLVGSIRKRYDPAPDGWRYLIDTNASTSVRIRLGLYRPPTAQPGAAAVPPFGTPPGQPAVPKRQ